MQMKEPERVGAKVPTSRTFVPLCGGAQTAGGSDRIAVMLSLLDKLSFPEKQTGLSV